MREPAQAHRPGLRGRVLSLLLRWFRVRPSFGAAGARWLAVGMQPEFDTERGEFVMPDVTIQANGSVSGDLPSVLDCPSTFHIYGSNAEWRFACGDTGPGSALMKVARDNATALAAGIVCADGCTKSVTENFAGWSCDWDWGVGLFIVSAAVELRVSCDLPVTA